MRLLRLLLSPYGSHERTELTLGGSGTLDVIYGPNEAGKSTLRRAVVGLFYGIEERTTDAHRFPGKDLRITADVLIDGVTRTVTRKKGRKTTLVDDAGAPVDAATWARALAGITREAYERGFGLDHELLRRGAEGMLSGDADLGESLLSASTGAVNLGRFREEQRERADAIYSDRAKTKALNEALATYAAKRRMVSELSTNSEVYLGQKRLLDEAEAARDLAQKRRTELVVEKQRAERQDRLGILFSQRKGVLGNLLRVGEVPRVTEEAARSRAVAADTLKKAETEIASLAARVQALSSELQANALRMQAYSPLAHVDEAEFLSRRGAVASYRDEHASKEAELAEAQARVATRLAAIAGDRPALSVAALSAMSMNLAELSQARSRRTDRIDAERVQLARIDAELSEVVDARSTRSASAKTALLVSLFAAEKVLERSSDLPRLRVEMTALHEELATLPTLPDGAVLPDESALTEVAALRTPLLGATLEIERELSVLRDRTAGIDTDLLALTAARVPSEAELTETRAARDALLSPAKGLETRMQALRDAIAQADSMADRMRRESDGVARRARLGAEKDAAEAQARKADLALVRVGKELGEVERRYRELFVGLPAPDPASASSFVRKALQGVALRARAVTQAAAIAALETEETGAANELSVALGGARGPLRALVETARTERVAGESAVQVEKEREEHRARKRHERADHAARLAALIEDERSAQRTLDGLLAELGLRPDSSAELAVQKAGALRELAEEEDVARKLGRDVAVIAERIQAHDHATTVLFGALALPSEASGERRAQTIAEMLKAQGSMQKLEDQTDAELRSTHARHAEAVVRRDAARATLDAAALHLGAKDYAELDVLEERSRERAKLLSDRDDLDRRISEAGGDPGSPIEDSEREAAQARLPVIEEELVELENSLRKANENIGGLRGGIKIFEQTDTPMILATQEEAQQELAKITDLTTRYARLVLTGMLLDERIAAHREENENDVLTHASALVAKITSGSIKGLEPSYEDEEHPVLVCLRDDGKQTPVAGLSDGTKDALYLSLRIASLSKLARSGQALPVLLDDVLIHMDDERAKVAVTALAELAKETQVLFFTHHKRMVELCEAAIPKAMLRVETI